MGGVTVGVGEGPLSEVTVGLGGRIQLSVDDSANRERERERAQSMC